MPCLDFTQRGRATDCSIGIATCRKAERCRGIVRALVQRPLLVPDMWKERRQSDSRLHGDKAPGGDVVGRETRLVHDGHHPRPLQLNATSRDVSQSSHATSTKPYRTSPHRWYASASRLTLRGTDSRTAGQPSSKARRTTDCSGARRRSPAPPMTPAYSSPLTPRVPGARGAPARARPTEQRR